MRRLLLVSLLAQVLLPSCQSVGSGRNFTGLSRAELRKTLGEPYLIEAYRDRPYPEYWLYYQKDNKGQVEEIYCSIDAAGTVATHYTDLNVHRLLSPLRPRDRQLIETFRQEREKNGLLLHGRVLGGAATN